ncbi:MAG: ATP synthase subunit b [Deltaproteobacteria bacterium SG8_13]|nr:MAG: ATP synthase subunit b [Deltaproteobacteria bacterium SG8_13]
MSDRHRASEARRCVVLLLAVVLVFFSTAAMGATDEHGTEAPAKGWVATDTYKVINFAVLAVALVFLLRKPVTKALNDRIQGIKDQLEDLESRKKQAEEELAAYNQKFQQLEQEAEKIVDQYIQQGREAKARILEEAQSAAEKLEEQARRNIDHEFKKARAQLQVEVMEKALAKAEEVIKSRISDKDQERLVDEYLEKVVA